MKRAEFIERLSKKLKEFDVADLDEIISEYEEHFVCKLADGYSEEEIAARLGAPEALALQFAEEAREKGPKGAKALAIAGLAFMDIFAGCFFALLYAFSAALAAFAAASAAAGICLLCGFNPYSLLPPMPYWCGAIMALSVMALAVLAGTGLVYYLLFVRQLVKAYGRCRRNLLASASGKAPLPPAASHPRLGARLGRRLRSIALISLTVFAVCFAAGFAACAVSAGALGFWHAWRWFVQ